MSRKEQKGFTLLELILVIIMLGILMLILVFVLKPSQQINKAKDAQRKQDITTIVSALDTFYSDTNCYPSSVPFGQKWATGDTIYMSKVPTDSQFTYIYLTDSTNACPQWNVLFSKLSNPSSDTACSLRSNCYPQNYDASWACHVSGIVDCGNLISQALPVSGPTSIASSENTFISNGNSLSQQISICHANGGATYNQVQVAEDATAGGHDGHADDIIPPYAYTCTNGNCEYPGKNWDNKGQLTYNNNCVAVTPTLSPTPTVTPTPVCPYTVGAYKLDDTQLYQTYAEFFFDPPSFVSTWYDVDVSLQPDFPNDYTQTYKYFAPAYAPIFTAGYSLFATDWLQRTTKYAALQSLPNLVWPQYQCGRTIYWKVYDFPGHTQSTQTFSNVIDCSTKVGAFSATGPAPLNWYIYYPYINGYTDEVATGQPYNSTMDANCDGKINWKDYVILDMNTKMRAGGWEPPE